mgnify:CR=1 FL=1
MCKHIWMKMYPLEDYTRFYCMLCLKQIKVKNWGRKSKEIIFPEESDEIIKAIKEECNWEENTTGLTFQDFKYAIKKVMGEDSADFSTNTAPEEKS